ncbi:hypothetical protein [Staphylococcus simulans]|uniref:hypothetical protein n=3 Tax=Staphylococcus simulans TaxID=1286 RepID=UPI000D1D40B0|nr:hypothetical protein [Staphylococcus simulans]PTJ14063.1 hypothetical protein BU040_00190 [Staphylococcus simulans]PTJ32869.1 hypothetical protein BU027_10195 [Staphylococcus simulans]PTJ42117.1 hypothetical protein BU022_08500 [Staphylococcus simulans]PTJ76066.1 hypothetical protein BU050_09340 [Staphylococcus simulans]RIN58501.1 hypothetical protein BU033_03980 [Staphylococcus simulans]
MGKVISRLLDAFSSNLADGAKEELKTETLGVGGEIMANTALDAFASLLPIMGGTISGHIKNKAIKNQSIYIKELSKRVDILEKANDTDNQEYNEKIDDLYILGSETSARTKQEEKIKYISNGVLNTIKHNFSYDISILYFSILDRMTILEIEILKQYSIPYNERKEMWGRKIIDDFNITDAGYKAAKNNLLRNGLLQNKTENYLQHDIDEIMESMEKAQKDIISIADYLKSSKSKKRLRVSYNKKTKNKTKDSVSISELGNDFIKYFISEDAL